MIREQRFVAPAGRGSGGLNMPGERPETAVQPRQPALKAQTQDNFTQLPAASVFALRGCQQRRRAGLMDFRQGVGERAVVSHGWLDVDFEQSTRPASATVQLPSLAIGSERRRSSVGMVAVSTA